MSPARALDVDMSDRPNGMLASGSGSLWFTGATCVGGFGYAMTRVSHRAELVAPIDPNLHALAIFIGVFIGILGGASYLGWWRGRLGSEGFAGSRNPLGPAIGAAMMPVLCCLCTSYGARRLVEYRAFHGLPVVTRPADFTVIGMSSGRNGRHLTVRLAPGGRAIELPIAAATFYAARQGDHLMLPVQDGRGGIERMVQPDRWPQPDDLRQN